MHIRLPTSRTSGGNACTLRGDPIRVCSVRVCREISRVRIHRGVPRRGERRRESMGLNIQNIAHKSKYSNIAELIRYVIYVYSNMAWKYFFPLRRDDSAFIQLLQIMILVLSVGLTRYSIFAFVIDTFDANEFDRMCATVERMHMTIL